MEGAEGFMLTYFHLCSLGIRVGLCLIVVLISVWNVAIGSEVLFGTRYIDSLVTWSHIGGWVISLYSCPCLRVLSLHHCPSFYFGSNYSVLLQGVLCGRGFVFGVCQRGPLPIFYKRLFRWSVVV
jgi:hypothetical protein